MTCDLTALSADGRQRREELISRLRSQVRRVEELSDGFALEFEADAGLCHDAMEFALLEHRCCAFLRLSIELPPGEGAMRLAFGGSDGVKDFLKGTGLLAPPAPPPGAGAAG
jgi:hypothetical protein